MHDELCSTANLKTRTHQPHHQWGLWLGQPLNTVKFFSAFLSYNNDVLTCHLHTTSDGMRFNAPVLNYPLHFREEEGIWVSERFSNLERNFQLGLQAARRCSVGLQFTASHSLPPPQNAWYTGKKDQGTNCASPGHGSFKDGEFRSYI